MLAAAPPAPWTLASSAALRGLGRTAYRGGGTASDAVGFAADHVGRALSAEERRDVMRGWAAERAEVAGV